MDNELLQEVFRQIGVMSQSISQLNHDYTILTGQHAEMTANVEWLMKFFWVIATASVGSFMATVWQIVVNRKKK